MKRELCSKGHKGKGRYCHRCEQAKEAEKVLGHDEWVQKMLGKGRGPAVHWRRLQEANDPYAWSQQERQQRAKEQVRLELDAMNQRIVDARSGDPQSRFQP